MHRGDDKCIHNKIPKKLEKKLLVRQEVNRMIILN
jgi:hypothetical protein